MFSEDHLDEVTARVEAHMTKIKSSLGPSTSVADKRRIVTESIDPLVELIEGVRHQIGKQMVELNEFVEENGKSFSDDVWTRAIEILCRLGDQLDSLDTTLRRLYRLCPDHPAFAECESPLSQ